MENLSQKKAMEAGCMKQSATLNKKDLRIIDRCSHFLGRMLDGRVYIYCGRCKKFVLVHRHK